MKTRGRKKKIFIPPDQLRYELLEGGKTYQAIGTENNSSREAIRQFAKKSGIDLRDRQPSWYAEYFGIPELKNKEWLLEQKEEGNLGLKNIATHLQISVGILCSQMNRLGLNPKDFIKRAEIVEISCSWCGEILKRFEWQRKIHEYAFCNRKERNLWIGEGFRSGKWKKNRRAVA